MEEHHPAPVFAENITANVWPFEQATKRSTWIESILWPPSG